MKAYTLIIAIALAPCVAVLWQQDALGTLLAAGILLARSCRSGPCAA